MSSSFSERLLTVEEVAERYRTSVRSIHGFTRSNRIPHIKRAGFRRVLFNAAELDAWDRGGELEVFDSDDGSRIVRTVEKARAA
jgi:excisionase family DNA binding protein